MARTGLKTSLETIQVIDQMTEQEMVEIFLNRNPTNIVNIVIKIVILLGDASQCKESQKAQGHE